MMRRNFLKKTGIASLFLSSPTFITSCSRDPLIFSKGQKIGFLGDSITYAGGYIRLLGKAFKKHYSEYDLELINLGMNSETITGLSEKAHIKPRPWLFNRLDSVLDKNQLDVAFFCYGMNCGIYQPLTKSTLSKYKDGLDQFLEVMRERKIKCILLTPPPMADVARPSVDIIQKEGYSWKNPYPQYTEEVIAEFRSEVLSRKHDSIMTTVDIFTPLKAEMKSSYGKDPIHPLNYGHEVIAKAIMERIGVKG